MSKASLNRALFLGMWLPFLAVAAYAQSFAALRQKLPSQAHQSLSGQFIVRTSLGDASYFYDPRNTTNLVKLEPDLLTVSCERIKNAMLAQLGMSDQWRGRIYLDLHHSFDPEEVVFITPTISGNDWSYRIQMPDEMERSKLVDTVVNVLLLEIANRNSTQSTEIPAWLSEGLVREVMRSSAAELVIEPPNTPQNGLTLTRLLRDNRQNSQNWLDPVGQAREYLRSVPPLTLEELNWPRDGILNSDRAEAYRSTAQLFVHQLLHLQDGRASMQTMIQNLPQHLNWQLTFFEAFHSDFPNQLALDKWWSLQLVGLTGRDLSQAWSSDESWRKLDELLHPAVEVKGSITESAVRTRVSLQSIIRDWSVPRQQELLREKAQQLLLLRVRISQDLVYLVDDYRRLLDNYLRMRANAVYVPMGKSFVEPRLDELGRDAIRQLDELDLRRQQLTPKVEPASVTASVDANH